MANHTEDTTAKFIIQRNNNRSITPYWEDLDDKGVDTIAEASEELQYWKNTFKNKPHWETRVILRVIKKTETVMNFA